MIGFLGRSTHKVLSLALLSAAIFSGCGDEKLQQAPGYYEGFVAVATSGSNKQIFVSANITSEKKYLKLGLASLDKKRDWTFWLRAVDSDTVEISTYNQALKAIESDLLTKTSNDCFENKKRSPRLCFDGSALTMDIPQWMSNEHLIIDILKSDGTRRRPVFEKPASYTLPQLIQMAISQSFDTRVEFEKVTQARLNAKHAALMLFPHITANTALTFAVFGSLGPLAIIGDLAPFLFPTRWSRAFQADALSEAEFAAMIIMKADAANIAEGLALSIERDQQVLAKTESNVDAIKKMKEELHVRVQAGLINPTAEDDMTATVNTVQRGLLNLKRLRAQEFSALALASGFFNPEAIKEVLPSGNTMPAEYKKIDRDAATELALHRSFELRQMDSLISAARMSKNDRYYAWIDPAGNPDGALGLGLKSYIEIGISQVQELLVKRERLQATIIQKVYDAVAEIESNYESYRLAKDNLMLQERKINTISENMRLGATYSAAELTASLQEQTRTSVEAISAEYSYYAAISKLNRLLYMGPYASLNPERGRIAIAKSAYISTTH